MHGVGPPLETAGQDGGRRWKGAKGEWVTSPCLTSTQHDWVLPLLLLGLGGAHQGRNSEWRDHLCSKAAREPHPPVQAHKRLGLYLLECGTRGRSCCLAGRRSCSRRDGSSVLLPRLYQMILY